MNKERKRGEKKLLDEKGISPGFKYTRRQTGIRIFASLFFGIVVWGIMETFVFLIVIFQIIDALIAERPNSWLIGFANHTIAYFYRVIRYLTFNEDRVPFPFSQFPEEIEKPEFT